MPHVAQLDAQRCIYRSRTWRIGFADQQVNPLSCRIQCECTLIIGRSVLAFAHSRSAVPLWAGSK